MGRKLDLGELTEEEEKYILQVIKRDYDVRKVESNRIGQLSDDVKKEDVKHKTLVEESKVPSDSLCARCGNKFVWLINPKVQCDGCELYFCKNKIECITYDRVTKKCFCSACIKQRDLTSYAGEWFYSRLKGKFRRHGGAKVSRELKKRKKSQKTESSSPSSSIVSSPTSVRRRHSDRHYDSASVTSRDDTSTSEVDVKTTQVPSQIVPAIVEKPLESSPRQSSDIEVQTDFQDDAYLHAIKTELEITISAILLPKLDELKQSQLEHQSELERQQKSEDAIRIAEQMIDKALDRAREQHEPQPGEENILLAKYLSGSKSELMAKVSTELQVEQMPPKSSQSSLREAGTMTETSDSEMESLSSASGRRRQKDIPLTDRLSSLSPESLRRSLGSSASSITQGVVLQKTQLVARADIENALEEILDDHGVHLSGSSSPQEFSTALTFTAVGKHPRLPSGDSSNSSDDDSSRSLLVGDDNWPVPEAKPKIAQFGLTGLANSSEAVMSLDGAESPYTGLVEGDNDVTTSSDREHVEEEVVMASQVRRSNEPFSPQSLVAMQVEVVETFPEKKQRLPVAVAVSPALIKSMSEELEVIETDKRESESPKSPQVLEQVILPIDRSAVESTAPVNEDVKISFDEKLLRTAADASSESELDVIREGTESESSESSDSDQEKSPTFARKINAILKPERSSVVVMTSTAERASLTGDENLMANSDEMEDKFAEVLASKIMGPAKKEGDSDSSSDESSDTDDDHITPVPTPTPTPVVVVKKEDNNETKVIAVVAETKDVAARRRRSSSSSSASSSGKSSKQEKSGELLLTNQVEHQIVIATQRSRSSSNSSASSRKSSRGEKIGALQLVNQAEQEIVVATEVTRRSRSSSSSSASSRKSSRGEKIKAPQMTNQVEQIVAAIEAGQRKSSLNSSSRKSSEGEKIGALQLVNQAEQEIVAAAQRSRSSSNSSASSRKSSRGEKIGALQLVNQAEQEIVAAAQRSRSSSSSSASSRKSSRGEKIGALQLVNQAKQEIIVGPQRSRSISSSSTSSSRKSSKVEKIEELRLTNQAEQEISDAVEVSRRQSSSSSSSANSSKRLTREDKIGALLMISQAKQKRGSMSSRSESESSTESEGERATPVPVLTQSSMKDSSDEAEVSAVGMRIVNAKAIDILSDAVEVIHQSSSSSSSNSSRKSSRAERIDALQMINQAEKEVYENASKTYVMEERLDQLEVAAAGDVRDPSIKEVMKDIEAEIDRAEKQMEDIRRGPGPQVVRGKSIDAILEELRGAGLEVQKGGYRKSASTSSRSSYTRTPSLDSPGASPQRKFSSRYSLPARPVSIEESRPVNAVDKDNPSWARNTFTIVPGRRSVELFKPASHSTPRAKSSSVSSNSSHSVCSDYEDPVERTPPPVVVDVKNQTELQATIASILDRSSRVGQLPYIERKLDANTNANTSNNLLCDVTPAPRNPFARGQSRSETSESSINVDESLASEAKSHEETVGVLTAAALSRQSPSPVSATSSSSSSRTSVSSLQISDDEKVIVSSYKPGIPVDESEVVNSPSPVLEVEEGHNRSGSSSSSSSGDDKTEIIAAPSFDAIVAKFESGDSHKGQSSSSESGSEYSEPLIKQGLTNKKDGSRSTDSKTPDLVLKFLTLPQETESVKSVTSAKSESVKSVTSAKSERSLKKFNEKSSVKSHNSTKSSTSSSSSDKKNFETINAKMATSVIVIDEDEKKEERERKTSESSSRKSASRSVRSGRFEDLSIEEQREMARIALLHLPETIIADDKYETKRMSVVMTETSQHDVTPARQKSATLQQELAPSVAPDEVKAMVEVQNEESSSSSSSSSSSPHSTPKPRKRRTPAKVISATRKARSKLGKSNAQEPTKSDSTASGDLDRTLTIRGSLTMRGSTFQSRSNTKN